MLASLPQGYVTQHHRVPCLAPSSTDIGETKVLIISCSFSASPDGCQEQVLSSCMTPKGMQLSKLILASEEHLGPTTLSARE